MARELVNASILTRDHIGDVETEMRLALLRAARTYVGRRGAAFTSYLYLVASSAGRDYVRHEVHILLVCGRSLDDFPSDEERDAYLCHSPCPHKDCHNCRQSRDAVEALVPRDFYEALPKAQQTALRIIAEGGSEADIARALGCSLEAARKLRQRLLKRLRNR